MHKIIYTGLEAPRDKQTYLWKRKDANGASALYEYRGTKWEKVAGGDGGGGMIETTYADLVDLRNSGSLSPGTWYRITDYKTTTSQENTRSAGHQFDVAVLALSGNELSEEARALHHEIEPSLEPEPEPDPTPSSDPRAMNASLNNGNLRTAGPPDTESDTESDTEEDYFSGCNLAAWKIWYCLDNDERRFGWATSDKTCIVAAKREGDLMGPKIRYYRDPEHDIVFSPEQAGTDEPITVFAWTSLESEGGIDGPTSEPTTIFIMDDQSEDASEINAMIQDKPSGRKYLNATSSIESDNPTHYVYHAIANDGKGVIYRMIDEHRNDCPFDFKNVQLTGDGGSYKYTFSAWRVDASDNVVDASISYYNDDPTQEIQSHDNSIKASHQHYSQNSIFYTETLWIPLCMLYVPQWNNGDIIHNVKIAEDCTVISLSAGKLQYIDIYPNVVGFGAGRSLTNADGYVITIACQTGGTKKMFVIANNMTNFVEFDPIM